MFERERYELQDRGELKVIQAWIFCETLDQKKNKRIRFYITDQSKVIFEFVAFGQDNQLSHSYVAELELLEHALDDLAALPNDLLDSELYERVLQDMRQKARPNRDS